MYCTKSREKIKIALPCSKALRQCWAQREPSCCIRKTKFTKPITKSLQIDLCSWKLEKEATIKAKLYLFVEDSIHIYLLCLKWNRNSAWLGRGKVYCFTTQNSLWRKEPRWTTMCMKVGRNRAVVTFLYRLIESWIVIHGELTLFYMVVFKDLAKSLSSRGKSKAF